MPIKPMLAGKVELDKLVFPLLASPKLDGVRALSVGGMIRSRKLLAFGNSYTNMRFSSKHFNGFDGEFILGNPTAKDVYRKTNSALSRHEGDPQLTWWVFDDYTANGGFDSRYWAMNRRIEEMRMSGVLHVLDVRVLPHTTLHDKTDLDIFEQQCVEAGYEGIMLRSIDGSYKFGRSTTNEGALLKLKRYEDMDAVVLSVEEEMHNGNVAERDELGRTKRSSAKAGKTGKGTMGALVCRGLDGPFKDVEFRVGAGFTAADRARTDWVGKVIKVKYFAVGTKDKPRHPVYLGDRDD